MRLHWLSAGLLTLGAAVALATACGNGSDGGASVDAGGNGDTPASNDGTCPTERPANGASCSLPEGTTCLFGACRAVAGLCRAGSWHIGELATGGADCPALPPTAGTTCPECWHASLSCHYGSDDCNADASANRTTASCPDGTWVVTVIACDGGAPPVDAGAQPDAGDAGDGG